MWSYQPEPAPGVLPPTTVTSIETSNRKVENLIITGVTLFIYSDFWQKNKNSKCFDVKDKAGVWILRWNFVQLISSPDYNYKYLFKQVCLFCVELRGRLVRLQPPNTMRDLCWLWLRLRYCSKSVKHLEEVWLVSVVSGQVNKTKSDAIWDNICHCLAVTEWAVGCWLDMGMTRTASKLTTLCMLNMSDWIPNTSQPSLPLLSHAAVQPSLKSNIIMWAAAIFSDLLMKAGRGESVIISRWKNTNYSSKANVKSLHSSNDLERKWSHGGWRNVTTQSYSTGVAGG